MAKISYDVSADDKVKRLATATQLGLGSVGGVAVIGCVAHSFPDGSRLKMLELNDGNTIFDDGTGNTMTKAAFEKTVSDNTVSKIKDFIADPTDLESV